MKVRFAVSPGGRTFDPDALIGFAITAERLGFDTIWLSDVPMAPIGDPLISLTHLAGITTRLKLGANLVPLGRNPMLLARQLAQLDRFSAGRLLLTFVPGLDQPGERRALGLPAGDRGRPRRGHHRPAPGLVGGRGRRRHRGRAPGRCRTRSRSGWAASARRPSIVPAATPTAGSPPAPPPTRPPGAATSSSPPPTAAGRTIDVEHFGISVPYARDTVPAEPLAALRARRKDDDLTDIVPVGAEELVKLLQRHIDAGLSKFVLRPLDPRLVERRPGVAGRRRALAPDLRGLTSVRRATAHDPGPAGGDRRRHGRAMTRRLSRAPGTAGPPCG